MNDIAYNEHLIKEIGSIITDERYNVVKTVNNELITAYWNIGRVIVEDELKNSHGKYGKQQMLELSKILTNKYGKGFSSYIITSGLIILCLGLIECIV